MNQMQQLSDKRFSNCIKELSDHDKSRLETLMEDATYSETLKYMKEHNVKLEQEIISYYLDKNTTNQGNEESNMAKKKTTAVIHYQTELATDIYDMWLETDLAKDAKPGQFIAVYPNDKSTLLPRPISICEVEREKKLLRIVYRIAGKGTTEFSGYKAGNTLDILGNLGNGFPLEQAQGKRVLLIGGGIGIPPMVQTAKDLQAEKMLVMGYRNNELFLREELEQNGVFYAATEDGSAGTKGNVLDAIRAHGLEADILFACGPMPMLRALKQYATEKNIEAYLSLEERMACGVGACLGCVCKTTQKDHHSHVNYARICTDGPVFNAREVDI